MGYYKKTTKAGNTLIVEKGYRWFQAPKKYRSRGKKCTPSSETMKKRNERYAVHKLTALMNENFGPGDMHLVLTYLPELRPEAEEARQNLLRFIRKLRALFRRTGGELKYIHSTEYKSKAIHHHILINYADLQAIQELWIYGMVRPTVVYSTNLKKLAEYFVKETRTTFQEETSPYKQRYIPSRNLRQPALPQVKDIPAESWAEEPKPRKGYYVDMDSLENGISEESGYPYQYYVMVPLSAPEPRERKSRREAET